MNTAEFQLPNDWQTLDPVYARSRRKLHDDRAWRYGYSRVREVAKEGYDQLAAHTSIPGKTYCDLGCGTFHPYSISAIMYLNGAKATIALDGQGCMDKPRAAEALVDLLYECIVNPEDWHWSSISRDVFLHRARAFNLKALRQGDLEGGIAGLPLSHLVTDIHNPSLPPNSIDIMSSRAVLEHFLQFDVAIKSLWTLMSKGGVAFHCIDIVDHRAYVDKRFHYWSFLAEEEPWADGLCNRLRGCEVKPILEQAGFVINRYEPIRGKMPEGFLNQVTGRFATMSEAELSTTTINCVITKP